MIRALTSAARLPVRQPSSTTTAAVGSARPMATSVAVVERPQAAQVDHLGSTPVVGQRLGGLQGLGQRAAVGDQAHVPPGAPDGRAARCRHRAGAVGQLALDVVERARARR